VHRTSYKYQLSDWDSFRNYLREAWKFFFYLLTNALVNHWVDSSWYWCFCIANISLFVTLVFTCLHFPYHFFHLFVVATLPRFFTVATKPLQGNPLEFAIRNSQTKISTQKLDSRDFWKIFNSISTIISLFDITVHLLVTVFCLSLINIFLKNLKTLYRKSHGWSVKLAIMIFGVRSKISLTYGRFDKNISYIA